MKIEQHLDDVGKDVRLDKDIHSIYKKYIEPNFPEIERWEENAFCDGISDNGDIYHVELSHDGNCCMVWCEMPEKVACIVYFAALEKGKGSGSRFMVEWLGRRESDWRYVLEVSGDRQKHFWKKCGFYPLYCPGYVQPITMGGNDIPASLMAKGSFPDTYPLERNLRKYVYGLNE